MSVKSKFHCLNCGYHFVRSDKFERGNAMCPKCGHNVSNVHLGEIILGAGTKGGVFDKKGSPDYYKKQLYKRNDKEWQEDIKNRVVLPNGKVVRRNG